MPSFLPRISNELAALLIQPPRWQEAFFSEDAAQEQDGLGQHQLGYRTGVGVWRVEHGDTALAGSFQVDLVGADAEAANGYQFLGAVEDLFGELGARTDADEVGIGDLSFSSASGNEPVRYSMLV